MNITCSHSRLRSALEVCERVITRHLTLPILNNVLLRAENNQLTISATNLEVGMVATIPCKTTTKGELTVPAKVFYGIIANLTGDTVTLFSEKKHVLAIEAGGYSGTVKGEGGDEFPIIPTLTKTPLFTIQGEVFSGALANVVPFTAVSDTRPELTGVLFYKEKKEEIDFVAADGFRLAQRKVKDFKTLTTPPFSLIVPQRTVAEIIRITKEEDEVEVRCDEKQLEVKTGTYRLISRTIEGTYPNHTTLIPTTFNTSAIIDTENAVKNIRLVSLLSSRINDIRLHIEPGEGVTFKTQDPDMGESVSVVTADIEGEVLEISFNWRYLLEGLQNIGDKKALMRFIDGEKAALIQPTKNKDYLYVVMPLRT